MRCLNAALLVLACLPARADVASSGANGFEIRLQRQLAGAVDGVITEQVDRLTRFIATGKPAGN